VALVLMREEGREKGRESDPLSCPLSAAGRALPARLVSTGGMVRVAA
jgi:hypothetical protein